MNIEERKTKVLINKAGGTAGVDSKSYRVILPSIWAKQLGITEENREVAIQFDGERIIIQRIVPTEYEAFLNSAREKEHDLLIIHYYNRDTLCTQICADRTTRQLAIKNQVSDQLSTAFGVNRNPDWNDFTIFLESRCIPRQRDGIKHYLEELGLERYDPLEIIRKTSGRMAEDACWIKIVEG